MVKRIVEESVGVRYAWDELPTGLYEGIVGQAGGGCLKIIGPPDSGTARFDKRHNTVRFSLGRFLGLDAENCMAPIPIQGLVDE